MATEQVEWDEAFLDGGMGAAPAEAAVPVSREDADV